MNLKIGKVFTSKFVGTGPSSYEKRIYRAAVSQRLRNSFRARKAGWHYSEASVMFPRRVVALGRYWSDLRSCSTQQKLGPYGGEVCRVLGDQAPWNQISKTPVLAFTKVVTVMGHAQHRNGWGKQAEAAWEEGKWPGDVVGGQVEPSGSLLECSQQLHRIAAPHGSRTVDTKEVQR